MSMRTTEIDIDFIKNNVQNLPLKMLDEIQTRLMAAKLREDGGISPMYGCLVCDCPYDEIMERRKK